MTTRERLVAAARDLFWRQGYHATSVNQLLTEADAGSGSLYHFFAGKEEVLVGVLQSYLEWLDEAVVEPAYARSDDPIERIFHVLDGYRTAMMAADFEFACPIGRIALEMTSPSEAVRSLIGRNFAQWCAAIERCLGEASARLPDELDRRGLAMFVLTTMEGAVMQSRIDRSVVPFDASVAHLRSYFAALEKEAALDGGDRGAGDRTTT